MNRTQPVTKIVIAMSLLLCFFRAQASWADVELKAMDRPIRMVMQTEHHSQTSQTGESFSAITQERHCVHHHCIPAQTQFKGQIIKADASRRYWRPGYLTIEIREVIFPNRNRLQIDQTVAHLSSKTMHDKSAITGQRAVLRSLPPLLAGSTTAIILHSTTDLSGFQTWALTTPVTAAAGVLTQLYSPTLENSTTTQRIALGLLSPLGVPTLVSFFHVYPNAHLRPGDPISLRFPEVLGNSLFIEPG